MNDAEEKVAAMEFIAPIVEAQMKFDQAVTNNLMDAAWGDAEKWACRFLDLISDVEKANDSMRVARVIDAHWQPDVQRTIAHYRSMRSTNGDANV